MRQYFGIVSDFGFLLFGVSAVILAAGSVWLRAKRLSRDSQSAGTPSGAEDRLIRIEQLAESIALETERIAEAQRFTSMILADRGGSSLKERTPERVITPH